MIRNSGVVPAMVLLVLCVLSCTTCAEPVGTAFTYQGKLSDAGGAPVSGSVDLTFKLFDAETDGSQIGTTVTLSGVVVTEGLFCVELDFGEAVFDGSARWLETTVDTQTLAPRTKLTSAPNAVYAQNVPWSGVSGAPASLPPSGDAGGDLTGTYPNPEVAADSITSGELAEDSNSFAKMSAGVVVVAGVNLGVNNPAPKGALDIRGYTGVVDQAQTSVQGGNTGGSRWQSFTAGQSGYLTAVAADIENWDASKPWTGTMTVYSGQGVGGTLLSSQTVVGEKGKHPFPTFLLAEPVQVVAGEKYTVVFAGDSMFWYGDNRNPYPDGRADSSADLDHVFKTFMGEDAPAFVIEMNTLDVGIGTESPEAKLDVAGTAKMTGFQLGDSATAGDFLLADANGVGSWQSLPSVIDPPWTVTDDGIRYTGGNVCIQTEDNASGQSILFQNSGGKYSWRIFRTDEGSGDADLRFAGGIGEDSYTDLSTVMTIEHTGDVGIGTVDPNYKLQVNGSTAGVGPYIQLSDIQYKTNIREIPDALGKVEALHGVTFDWKQSEYPDIDFDDARQAGLIAQELETVLPEAVTRDGSGNLSVSYSSVIPLLIEGMKEQQRQIEELKALVESLVAR